MADVGKSSAGSLGVMVGIVALIIAGLNTMNIIGTTPEVINGGDGLDGTEGNDAPGGLVVGILDPDMDDVVSGTITIRALIYGTTEYTINISIDGTEIGSTLPLVWDTNSKVDGIYTLTVKITDDISGNSTQDSVLIEIDNDGSDNQNWISCPFELSTYVDTIRYASGYSNADGTDFGAIFHVPLSTNFNGEQLYITSIKIQLTDADADDYIDYIRLFGNNESANVIYTNDTNFITDGTIIYSIPNMNLSIYDSIQVYIKNYVTDANDLDVSSVSVRYYYN